MYKVFYDDQLLYLPGDQELIIFNTKLELADNKSGSFEFDIPAVNPMYDKMKKLTSVIRVEKDGVLWSSIFVTLMANKIGGLQFGIYRNCQISSRVFHTAVAALPLTKANRSDFE